MTRLQFSQVPSVTFISFFICLPQSRPVHSPPYPILFHVSDLTPLHFLKDKALHSLKAVIVCPVKIIFVFLNFHVTSACTIAITSFLYNIHFVFQILSKRLVKKYLLRRPVVQFSFSFASLLTRNRFNSFSLEDEVLEHE